MSQLTPCLVIFSTLLFQIVSLPFGSLQSSLKSSCCPSRLHFKIFGSNLLDAISREISSSVGEKFSAISFRDNAGGGGGGARVGSVVDKFQQEYFVKSGSIAQYDMLRAEYFGVKEIYDTGTIRVPQPIAIGVSDYDAFVVFEKLNLGGMGKPERMAEKLAAMHRCTSPSGKFGWKMDNTIGATFQPNTETESWSEFWDKYRLGHMLSLAKREGATFSPQVEQSLREKVKKILDAHVCEPSLVHGDLWSGNQAYTKGNPDGEPVIFDPAVYYGDREVDIAMTHLFGSNSASFYSRYNECWPSSSSSPEGFELRKTVYNLYHILNHFVLFGGGYLTQAQMMMGTILKAPI